MAAQPAPVDVPPEPVDEQPEQTQGRRVYRPDEVFATTTLDEIKKINESNIDELARYAVETYKKKERYIKTSFGKYINFEQWYKKYIWRNTVEPQLREQKMFLRHMKTKSRKY